MFGLKRRAQEKAEASAAEWAAVGRVVYDQMIAELTDVLTIALDTPGMTDADRDAVTAKAKGVVIGLKAVLIDKVDAFGPDMKVMPQPVQCGAMSAHAARNLAFLLGPHHNENIRGDMAFGIGLSRDVV